MARSHLGDHLTVSASQRDLRFAASELGAQNFMRTGILTLRLFGAFADRIYANAKTEEQLAAVRADPVPNRHAAIHGLAIYNTQKSSLNALFIAEFVLLTIDAVKAEALGQAEALPLGPDQAPSLVSGPRPKIAGAPELTRRT